MVKLFSKAWRVGLFQPKFEDKPFNMIEPFKVFIFNNKIYMKLNERFAVECEKINNQWIGKGAAIEISSDQIVRSER